MPASLLERIADGRTDLVWDWVAEGRPATATDAGGVRLVEWCAYYGDVSAVRLLLDRGESLASLGENLGLSAAAFHGHWRLCEFLLEVGADASAADEATGETALHSALCTPDRRAHDLVVRVLLAHGADVHRATRPGVETGSFMRDARTKGETALHRAAAFGNEETIALLLDAGARKDAVDASGDTPLGWASWSGRPDAVLRLLLHGEHRIHPDRKPMAAALLGWPRGGGGGMATSSAKTVAEYLEGLPKERRAAIEAVRKVVRKNLPKGYREAMGYGMIAWQVPLGRYPDTYNGEPLCYAALASQKNYCALYLTGVYQVPAQAAALRAAFKAEGKKADMGKSCIRFRTPDDLPLATIGKLVASTPVETFVARYEASRRQK